MKSNHWLLALLSATLLLRSVEAFAQPAPLNAPMIAQPVAPRVLAPLDEANWRAIRVQNVPPSLIAYQLDPVNNKWPAYINMPPLPGAKPRVEIPRKAPTEKRAKGPFDLPGEMRLVASDEQNLIFIAGGDAAQIARLQELVSLLDQPLRQVEIEAQIVELLADEPKRFGLGTNAATADAPRLNPPVVGVFQTSFVRGDFQKHLDELVAAGTAKVVSTGPLMLTNNMGRAVSLRSGPIDNTGANQYKPPVTPANGTDTIITLTPTINGDDTITVLMNIATLPLSAKSSGLETVVNLRDGDTIALMGLKSSAFPRLTNPKIPMLDRIPLLNGTEQQNVPLLSDIPINGKLFRSKKLEDANTVLIFLTARIVRADEK